MLHWVNALVMGVPAASTMGALVGLGLRHARQQRQLGVKMAELREIGADIPVTLHPVIDPAACICSGACMQVCPEGGIIQIVGGAAKLVEATQCIGHGACAEACPVKAIKLVFGSAERGVDLPEVSKDFESSRPGVFVVGELGGMGLIKNAMTQGLEAADAVHAKLGPVSLAGAPEQVDVAIVGAGPAGLATAMGLSRRHRTFALLEQGKFGGAVANYPRHKVVMTDTVPLPFYGEFGRSTIIKEDLLGMMEAAAAAAKVSVREHTRVTGITGTDGGFTVETTQGPVLARKVVMAMGRRGTPRALGATGEDLPKVTYNLIDPAQYNDARVLVVGAGDVAMESAIMLAEDSSAEVTMAVRGASFARGRRANKDKITALIEAGRIKALMRTEVREVTADRAVLEMDGKRFPLANDYIIVNVGGTLPDAFLKAQGIDMRRHFGTEERVLPPPSKSARAQVVHETSELVKYLLVVALAFGFFGLVALAMWGHAYYHAPVHSRIGMHLHRVLRPAGPVGRAVGMVSALMMLLNFGYAVRKRVEKLGSFGSLTDWLNMHMIMGATTPLFVAFHAAFQSNNLLASATAGSLAVVVGTGIFGRFLFTLVPMAGSEPVALAELLATWTRLRQQVQDQAAVLTKSEEFQLLDSHLAKPPTTRLSLRQVVREHLQQRRRSRELRAMFDDAFAYRTFQITARQVLKVRLQVAIYDRLRHILLIWRALHIVLSCSLVAIMAMHIGVAIYLGYGKLF